MPWMIDGNKLKEKAVPLLFPTKMEPCGHLPNPVQAVTVSEIEGMLYREGVEVVHCAECTLSKHCKMRFFMEGYYRIKDPFCAAGERRENQLEC